MANCPISPLSLSLSARKRYSYRKGIINTYERIIHTYQLEMLNCREKELVVRVSVCDEEFKERVGTIHMEENTVYIDFGDMTVTLPMADIIDFIKSELCDTP